MMRLMVVMMMMPESVELCTQLEVVVSVAHVQARQRMQCLYATT